MKNEKEVFALNSTVIVFLFLYALGSGVFFPKKAMGQTTPGNSEIIALAGGGTVLQQDILDWQAAQACYGEDALTSRRAGFMRMFEATILEEVLRQQAARPLTPEDYKKEVERIDSETRAPDILACIKKHFGDDTGRYKRIFIRPILVQQFIHEFVKSNPKVQEKAYGLRAKISTDVVKGVPFKDIASAPDVAYSSATYSLEADTQTAAGAAPWERWSPFEAAFIEENLKELAPGQAKQNPIEDETDIKFVRLISVDGKKYYFESLTVPKLTTEGYLKAIPKLPCRINDKELHDWAAPIRNPILVATEIAP
ncbi:MAG: hypothetical protein NTX59_12495 [Elusimicrobia bacterium]|nr:hypothetical protein [Elusimicrobiota bacterium]